MMLERLEHQLCYIVQTFSAMLYARTAPSANCMLNLYMCLREEIYITTPVPPDAINHASIAERTSTLTYMQMPGGQMRKQAR
jgi:hypothetical protein